MSDAKPEYSYFLIISGAMYEDVPQNIFNLWKCLTPLIMRYGGAIYALLSYFYAWCTVLYGNYILK